MCCPVLYNRALESMYNEKTGYEKVFAAKLTPYRVRRYRELGELETQIVRTEPAPVKQQGDERDIMKLWKRIYKEKGWAEYAPFNMKGGFNKPCRFHRI